MNALAGPWKIESETMRASVLDADGDPVCTCDCGDAAQDEINARAIAVMPEVLETLRAAEQSLAHHEGDGSLYERLRVRMACALAKAEGA